MKLEKYKQRNPKKIGIAIFTIACVFLIAFGFIYSSFASFQTNETRGFINGNVVDPGDLYFAFYVDGKISSTMPAKGEGYVLDSENTTCTNGASVLFDASDWSIKVLNLTIAKTSCNLFFKKQSFNDTILECNDTAANCIKNNASSNTVELVDDETVDHNIRYIGADPNNYVRFNNELWRIIGVFNNIDNGSGAKETRIKLIKATFYRGISSWDNNFANDWLNASSQKGLNGVYLDSIESTSKSMISDAVWNLGGTAAFTSSSNGLASHWYNYERGTAVYSGNATTWTGKIALMYPSDYGFAVGGENRDICLNTELYSWNKSGFCIDNDWLFNKQWTLASSSVSSNVAYYIETSGNVLTSSTDRFYSVFPALYLNADVKIVSGDGSESNPFVLSL